MNLLPTMAGTIDRRVLVNFRVDPDVARAFIPPPFEPDLSFGVAIAGICLIRLTHLRPRGVPGRLGVTTENAAHRFAVELDTPGGVGHGVYIPRRDTASRVTLLAGGRAFPGDHHFARFHVDERDGRHELAVVSDDHATRVAIGATEGDKLPATSVFRGLDVASDFFRRGAVGYSATRHPERFDAMELRVERWKIDPLVVDHVESSFFGDTQLFPPGSVEFDGALVMRPTKAQWISHPQVRADRTADRAYAASRT